MLVLSSVGEGRGKQKDSYVIVVSLSYYNIFGGQFYNIKNIKANLT